MDIPIVLQFVKNNNFYIYDTNKNCIISTYRELYDDLAKMRQVGISSYLSDFVLTRQKSDIVQLMKKGYFKTSRIKQIKHPYTDVAPALIDRCIGHLVLQITQNCNFLCRYCHFANDNSERSHSNVVMSFDIAKESIDFLYKHSRDLNKIKISFYGGEPLLEYNLIVNCINYARSIFITKELSFGLTTNASLLTSEMISFFEKNNVDITISLDGPKTIHDNHRRYRYTGEGSFDIVYSKINMIRREFPHYFENYLNFNGVYLGDEDYSAIDNFFINDLGVPLDNVSFEKANLQGVSYLTTDASNNPIENFQVVNNKKAGEYDDYIKVIKNKKEIPDIWHHNGPCIPGIRKLFVTVNGDLFPCEKVMEGNNDLNIGNIATGIDIKRSTSLLNIGLITNQECNNCWAIRFCSMCAISCQDNESGNLSRDSKMVQCKLIKAKAKSFLQSIV